MCRPETASTAISSRRSRSPSRENSFEIPVGAKTKRKRNFERINTKKLKINRTKTQTLLSTSFSRSSRFLFSSSEKGERVRELILSINNQLAPSCDDIIEKSNKRINEENSFRGESKMLAITVCLSWKRRRRVCCLSASSCFDSFRLRLFKALKCFMDLHTLLSSPSSADDLTHHKGLNTKQMRE